MSKSLQRGILFSICVALVLALSLTLVFFAGGGDKNLTAPQGQVSATAQNTTSYTHGSNIGRPNQTSGTPVGTAEALIEALATNGTYYLTNNIDLNSSQIFIKSNTFRGTLYGNGHTITLTGKAHSTSNVVSEMYRVDNIGSNNAGALISKMQGGKVYDLNIQASGDFKVIGRSDDRNTNVNVGLLAGWITGGSVIDNVSVTLAANSFVMAMGYGTPSNDSHTWHAAGLIGGVVDNNNTITNITATVNGIIDAGTHNSNDQLVHEFGGSIVSSSKYTGVSGAVVGKVEASTTNVKIDNIIVAGSGQMRGACVGLVAFTSSNVRNSTATVNIFNKTTSNVVRGQHYWSYTFLKWDSGSSWTVNNYYRRTGAQSDMNAGYNPQNTINVSDSQNVYFDPKQGTNYANSLAVAFNQAPVASYKYTLVSGNGNTYENPETTSNAIVFRKLPTDATIWNSGGNFTAVLESEFAGPQHRQPDLQPYEHGYTTGTPSGTPINDGSKFEELFSKTGSVQPGDTSTYYLTEDIVITGFTGKQFAGTLDGNGHTIYIAASDTSLAGHTLTGYNGNAVGGVIGALSGTIKNVRVVIDANITVGLNADLRGRVGGVVGRLLNGGSIENVQVIIPGDITLSYTNAGANDVSMGAVVGQATGASTISGLTVQMDGTLAPVGSYVWVSAVVGEIQAKSDHADTVSMNNIIVRGTGTFAAKASQGTSSGEPPYVSALATFNNNGENYPLVNLDGLIYDFAPTFSADGSAMYGLFVNNDSDGNTANYGNYVADSNLFIMQGREYTPTKTGTEAGNTYIPLDGVFKTVNTSVTGADGATVAAYFMPGTGLVRLQVHSDSWGDERLTISGVKVDGKPIMSSLATAGDSSSDRYFSVDKSTLSGLGAAVQVSLFSNVTDPTVQGLTYTGSPLDIVIDMSYNGVPLTAGDYSLSKLTASGGNALVQDGKPLNAGEYSVTVTLNNPDHWFGIDGSGEASKTANVTFTVSPKNVTMQDPDPMTAVYGTKYWILSDNNVWGLDEDLFFDEEVGNVEYTATVTREDDGEGYASASGWLKAGSYRVALTINDSNYAINGNASVIYPLTITPVGLSYTLTVENSVAATYDGTVRTISGTPQGGDGIISAVREGSAGTAGDSVTAAVSVTYGGVAAQIQNAGDYVLGVALSGDDAENYTAVLTASWTGGGAIENNTVTVEKYPFTLQWSFDSNVALEYGDDITDDLIAETELFAAAAIPFNGGSFTGKISFNVVSAVYNGGTAYAPGVAAGTNVTFTVAPVLPDVLDENNYNISLSASGSGTKMVAQRTLTVNYDAFDMTAVYGDSISNEWLTTQYQEQIAQSITNIYNNDNVTFKIILYYRTFGGAYQEISDFSALEMGVTYMAAVVVDGNDNYTIPNSLSNGYDFNLTARTLTISGITWAEDGFDGVYDGQAHALKAVLAEGSSIKEGDEGVLKLSVESITKVSDSGSVTVSVASKYAAEYNLTGTTEFTVTLDKKTLNILPYNTANFLDHDVESLYAHLTNAESGLINGVVEGDTLTFGGTWATVPTTVELGGKSYVAAGSYTLNMNPPSGNYQFDNNAMSVTVNELDISSAEVTWKESDLTYDAAKQSVSLASVTVNGVALPVEWFNLTDNTGTDADTYTATVAASNANITGSVSKDFTIAPFAVTVKWEAAGEISVGTAMPENATDMSALDLTARVTEFNAPGITDAAQYSIVVTASGFDAGHSFAMGEQVTLTPSMTFAEGVKAGNYLVTFDPENIVKTATAISVVIKPANATPAAVIYGNSVKNANEFISSEYFFIESGAEGSALTADNFTVTVTDENGKAVFGMHGLDAGTYTVTIEGKGAYSVSNDDNSFTYTVAPLTLTQGTWSDVDGLTYNGKAAVPKFEPEGVLDGDNVSVGYTIVGDKATGGQAINAGSYTVTAEITGGEDMGNYVLDGSASTSFTIAQMVLQGEWKVASDMNMTYDGTSKAGYATWTWTTAPLKEGDVTANITFTKDGEQADPIAAGDYTAIVTFTDNTDNYDTTEITSTVDFTIAPKSIGVAWTNTELIYNGLAQVPTATATGLVGDDSLTLNVTGAQTNAGSYTATVAAFEQGNYKLAEEATIEFTIAPKSIGVEWTNTAFEYDGAPHKPTATATGLVGDDSLTLNVTGAQTNAGSYTATVAAFEQGNYKLAEEATIKFTIARKTVSVAWGNTEFTYNGSAQKPNATVGEGLVSGDDLQITVRGEQTNAGDDYTATAEITGGEDMGNYVLDGSASTSFTIAPKSIGVEWTNTEFTYDGTAHKPTATATELVGEDTLTLTVTGEQTNANAEGETYTATVKAFIDGNYKLEQDATVEFTIAPKTVSVEWTNTAFTYNGSAQKPNATVGVLDGDNVSVGYTIEGDKATDGQAINAGSYTVTAEITGGEDMGNYVLDESSASTSFTIAPKPITITFTANDGANPINFDVAGSVTVGAWTIDGGNAGRATLVLSDGTTDITLTVEAASGEDLPTKENVPALLLLLGSELYVGTPYGTKVEGGSLTVISADTNYVFEGAQAITLNITPAISVGLKADVETERGLTDVLKTAHNADYFKNNYLQVTGKDGAEVTGGTLEVTITPSEGLEEGAIKHAGTYTVKAVYTPAGAGNGAEKPTFSFEFIVTPVEVTSVTYSGEPLVYGDLSESGVIAVTVEYADGKKAENVTAQYTSENVSTARYVKAGEQTIKVSYTNDDSDYAAVTEHEIKLTVEKKTITPSAISYGGVTSEGTTLTLTYAGKSAYAGNLVIEPVGILSRDVVEFISEKDYSAANEEGHTLDVKIRDVGDGGNYTLDLNGWKVVVLKKTIEVTVNADSYTYTGSAIKLTASSEEIVGEDDVTFTVSGENVNVVDQTVTNAGTYDLTVTLGGEQGGNYEVAGEPSVTIGKAGVEIVWTNEDELESAVYNGQPYEVKVDVRFNGQSVGSASIKYTSDEVTVTEAVNAGSYTAEATFAGTDNFNATTASYDFTIAKMVLNGEWKVASDMNMTYDGTSKEGYATWTWTTEPVNESDVTVGYKYELGGAIVDDVIDAGNYNVYAVFTGNTGNYDIKSDIFELTVARRAVTVKWSESVSFIYNGAEQAPAATAQNVVEGDSLTLTVTGAQKDVGTYTATVEAASVTGNYVLAEDATVKFTIAPKSIGVAWGNTAFTYNGLAQKPTATATGLVEGDSLTLTVTGEQTNANAEGETYTATVKAFEQGNYKLESTSTKAFTIKKADLTVTPASLEIRERETDVMQAFAEGADLAEAFAGRISVSGVSGTVSYTVTIAGEDNYDDDGLLTVGAHTFTIDAGGNYNAASVSVTVIATPVVTVIASVEGELVYNGSAFEISYALKEGAPEDVSMDDITVTASVETIVNAGEYTVIFTVTGSNEDYDYVVQDASGNAALTFTIAKRGLDVAEVAEAVYGDLQVSGTLVTGTHTAFVAYNDEEIELIVNVKTAALSRAAAEYLDAGEYEVTIALANEEGNFSLNGATLNAETEKMEVQSTLDVAPKTIEVGYKPSSPDYDAKGISLTLEKFEDMLIEGDDPAVNIYINDAPYTGKVVLDAGEYTVRYESADPNYAFTPVSATFTVAPKSVTPNFDLNTGSGSLQITGGGKLEIEEGEETDIVAAIDNFMQSSGVPEEDMSISVSGDLKLEDMATWAPGTYTVTVTLSGNHSGSMQFTVEVSEKVELPPPVEPELPETPVEAGSGNDWVLPLVIAIVALIDLALLVAIGVAAKKRA